MNTDLQNHDEWSPCPPGTLQQLGSQLHSRRRQEQVWRIAAQASVLLLVLGATWFFTRTPAGMAENYFGGISCTAVHQALPAYMRGQVEPATAEKIKLHLAACPMCQDLVRKMGSSSMPQAAVMPAHSCPHCGRSHGWPTLTSVELAVADLLLR